MPKSLAEVLAVAAAHKAPMEIPYDNIPEERGAFAPAPQPGAFRFELPQVIDSCFDIIEMKVRDKDGAVIEVADPENPGKKIPKTEPRLNLVFEGDKSLKIVQSPGGVYDGEDFRSRISGAERRRFAAKGVYVNVADLTYLLRAMAPEEQPKTLEESIATCLRVLPGKQFGANVEWQGTCDEKKDAYFALQDGTGETTYEPVKQEGTAENIKGCGGRVYQADWPKDPQVPGKYSERATCPGPKDRSRACGASLRPYAQLAQFRP